VLSQAPSVTMCVVAAEHVGLTLPSKAMKKRFKSANFFLSTCPCTYTCRSLKRVGNGSGSFSSFASFFASLLSVFFSALSSFFSVFFFSFLSSFLIGSDGSSSPMPQSLPLPLPLPAPSASLALLVDFPFSFSLALWQLSNPLLPCLSSDAASPQNAPGCVGST